MYQQIRITKLNADDIVLFWIYVSLFAFLVFFGFFMGCFVLGAFIFIVPSNFIFIPAKFEVVWVSSCDNSALQDAPCN
jgi:hypothetical protein